MLEKLIWNTRKMDNNYKLRVKMEDNTTVLSVN